MYTAASYLSSPLLMKGREAGTKNFAEVEQAQFRPQLFVKQQIRIILTMKMTTMEENLSKIRLRPGAYTRKTLLMLSFASPRI
jgi:hypothetical protein